MSLAIDPVPRMAHLILRVDASVVMVLLPGVDAQWSVDASSKRALAGVE